MKVFGHLKPKALALGVLLFLALGEVAACQTSNPPGAKHGSSAGYVGADTCKTCHEDVFKDVQKTRHWNSVLKTKTGDEAHSCETCHGPGAAHVDAGGDKTKIFVFKDADQQAVSDRCLACHNRKEETSHFSQSAHAGAGVSCISCHSPHFAKEPRRLLVAKQPTLCYQCHTETKADFNKPFRHRVNEGLIRCSDCHNPHGTPLTRSLRAEPSQDAVCFKCHRSLQGPYVFEHVPVKTEGCQSCHQVHGSINPRMLKVNQVNILCQQCHTPGVTSNTRAGEVNAPGTPNGPVHDQSAKFQACTMCHVQIHGSNADETFMK